MCRPKKRQTENNHDHGIDNGQGAEPHQLAHRLNVIGHARHQIAGLGVLEIIQRQFLQVGEDAIPQIRLAAPREAIYIDAPAIAETTLEHGRAQDQ